MPTPLAPNVYRYGRGPTGLSVLVTNTLFATLLATSLTSTANAETWLNITLVEPPIEEYEFWDIPSMNQSSDLTLLAYQGWGGLSDYWRQTRFQGDDLSPLILDAGMWVFVLPHPAIWMRNAWQQDILLEGGLTSRSNASYLWSDTTRSETYVYQLTDQDLASFRDDDPANFARLGSVRYEASQNLLSELSEANFFAGATPRYRLPKAYVAISDILSLHRCRNDEFDLPSGESELEQDVVGYDCRHWVYELHNPDASYEDRPGRYIAHDDLSDDEQEYLDRAFYFSFLNLLDAHYFDERNGTETFRFSFQPTPFGRTFGWHQLSLYREYQLGVDLYWQQNDERQMPAGRFSIVDYDMGSGQFTGRVAAWQQPDELRFDSDDTDTGWAVEASYSQPVIPNLRLQGDWHYKSDGWYPGYASLQSGSGWRFGVDIQLF